MNVSGKTLLTRLRLPRRTSLLLFGAALCALILAAVWFAMARNQLAQAYEQVSARQQAVAEANQQAQEAQLRVSLATGAKQLLTEADKADLVPSNWGERRINIRQGTMNREDINDLLNGVTRSRWRIFGADEFEVSVTRPEESLFEPPTGQMQQPIMLSMHGGMLFKIQQPAAGAGP